MIFTALHRVLGRPPGPLSEDMINEAVARNVHEADDLDWKAKVPPAKDIHATDFPKDVAAMANSGGGVLVFGVEEAGKAATKRRDVGEISEAHERALRSAAVTAISPPIFGLEVERLGGPEQRCLVVVVPGSIDGPHLIYRGEYFGAPIRNDADTVWMKERQIEAMYRARFDERRNARDALSALYTDAAAGRDASTRAWFVGVARPIVPAEGRERLIREQARQIFAQSGHTALTYAGRGGIHPLESLDVANPRPGLRRWVAPNAAHDGALWKEAWGAVYFNGSVTLASAVGGHRTRDGELPGGRVRGAAIECAVADFMALVRNVAAAMGLREYEAQVALEWAGPEPLIIQTIDQLGFEFDGTSLPIAQFQPVSTSVQADAEHSRFLRQVYELAEDCVNQGGVSHLRLIERPEPID